MDTDYERDTEEEEYNRNFCGMCDSSPCMGGKGKGSCEDAMGE